MHSVRILKLNGTGGRSQHNCTGIRDNGKIVNWCSRHAIPGENRATIIHVNWFLKTGTTSALEEHRRRTRLDAIRNQTDR